MGLLIIFTLISFVITDTLIRDSKESKIKSIWLRLFKKKIILILQERGKRISNKINSQIPRDHKGRPDLSMYLKNISEKYAHKVFLVFITLLLITIISVVLSFIKS